MRIVMPLFEFELKGTTRFAFADCALVIEPLTDRDIPRIALFSEQDIGFMQCVSWALVYESSDTNGYKSLVNLLLIAFRVLSDNCPPFIKYRLCAANPQLCTRLGQPMLYNDTVQRPHKPFDGTDLKHIDNGFKHLRRMDAVSPRTHNALYFAHRAFHTDKWIDSFLLLMSSLEALFSNDTPGAATGAITRRVSSLLGNRSRCTDGEVKGLYRLRSDMTHGRVVVDDDARKNLEQLGHLEFVTNQCFRELVNTGVYAHYETSLKREQFMRALDARP
jgi:hypothetical protein